MRSLATFVSSPPMVPTRFRVMNLVSDPSLDINTLDEAIEVFKRVS